MKRATEQYNLLKVNPDLAQQWHPRKNGSLRPQDVTPHAGKKVWWKCENGHEWEAVVNSRARGSNCPFCGSRVPLKEDIAAWNSFKEKILPTRGTREVYRTSSGKVVVEMPLKKWETLCLLTLPLKDLGKLIVQYQRTHRMTKKEFAEAVGYHRNSLLFIERGQHDGIPHEAVRRIIAVILE